MDFSPAYIGMCEKAVFIQQIWNVAYGDFYCDKSAVFATRDVSASISLVDDKVLIDVMNQGFKRSKAVWLPRQDQLQELLNITEPLAVIQMLNEFLSVVDDDTRRRWTSMEQLLLCAYALRTYKKTWTGADWK
ncbi:hypothetical protein [Candidatus Magnetominusculus dajiuhuensis]|uniref:hypothetical protein n=1 Tax=Candidatus Magnetominusculus dajiuhuensis TaxID=3137712 RepID=UPI003B42AADA